ncbi:hypothetical protein [Nocardioides kribbensis]|uniref:hypothetical protein n=1 Tax=Nocardioides kribbensis TaxID=305517 RepID=UPI0032D9B8A1
MRTQPARLLVALLLPALLLALGGCADLRAQVAGAADAPASGAAEAPDVLTTSEWAVTDGLLSVLVRNEEDRTLRTAEVTLEAFDRDGVSLGTWSASAMVGQDACCTVTDLAPGEIYGLYFPVGVDVGEVAAVDLDYRDVAWQPAATDQDSSTASATGLASDLNASRTVVNADLTVGSADIPQALVQAILRGVDGQLVAVVTGVWTCLTAFEVRPIEMQLFQGVPEGTVVDSITVRPLDPSTSPVAPTCG